MANQEQIKKVAAKIYLDLDNPQSVKKQLQQINHAHKKLREQKHQANLKVQEINKQYKSSKSFGIDEAAAIGLHLFGKHRVARQVTRQGNQAERRERNQHNRAKQPHIKTIELIDKYIFEAERLQLMAKNYLQNNK